MKTIRVFAVPSHITIERTGGVDWARVIQPMKALNGYRDDEAEFIVNVYDPVKDKTLDWLEVSEKHDIIFFNYTALPWEFAKMGLMVRKFNRKLVLDLDDSLWDIMSDNPAYIAFKRGSENIRNFTAICNEVDCITTTTKYLRNVISHNTDKPTDLIKILPNYIDLDKMYPHRSPFKDTHEIKLLHFGSTTHFIDLQNEEFENGIDMVMKEYPNVILKTVGAMIPKYKHKWGRRYENSYGHQDVFEWAQNIFPPFADETDIFVTPLAENRYTMCKSSIKYLEASSTVKPGVWQRMRQYEEVVTHGVNGFLARYATEWHGAIKKLIDDKQLRRSVANNAFETVKRDWQMKDRVEKYAQVFKSLLS